jgi:uncharacterized Zn-binding protein involved in type VI secretion
MSALEAARLGDQIGHTSAMKGLLAGLVAGLVITGLVLLAAGATVATGGAAAVVIGALIAGTCAGGLAGMKIGATFDSDPKGPIITGSPDTFLGPTARPAARATRDTVQCNDHELKLIAQGSTNVFINQAPAARHTDGTVCSAKIREGQPDVFFGGPTGTYLPMESEVPGWLVTTLEIGVWVGAAIATGGAILTVGIGAALGGLAGGLLGGWAGGKIGAAIGGLFGARGAIIGEVAGGFLGSMLGGALGAKGGNALEGQLPTETLARLPGASDAQIQARMDVARDFYNNAPDFAGQTARIDSHMSGIDFTKPVSVQTLDEPTTFSQYQNPPGGGTGNYVAAAGTPARTLGIGGDAANGPKVIQDYEVPAGTQVLTSTSSPKVDTWSAPGAQPAEGGGQQVFVGQKSVLSPVGTAQPADPALLQPSEPFAAAPATPGQVPVRGDGAFTPPSVGGTGAATGVGPGTAAAVGDPTQQGP